MKKITKSELDQIVQELEKEFLSLACLKKSEMPKEDEAEKEEEKKELADQIAAEAKDRKDQEEAKKEDEQEKLLAEPADQEEKAEAKDDGEDKQEDKKDDEDDEPIYSDEELEELKKLYQSMSEKERKIHREILEKCGDVKVVKSEGSLGEKEIEAIKQENELLKKSLNELVNKFLKALAPQAPARKTVSSIEVLKKGEDTEKEINLSKSQVAEILKKKSMEPTLSKSDRELISRFFIGGQKDINLVKHLLK
ncbi:MAG: hypothetical protein QW594_03860 [Candidatus Woesearchaeota archaeon]